MGDNRIGMVQTTSSASSSAAHAIYATRSDPEHMRITMHTGTLFTLQPSTDCLLDFQKSLFSFSPVPCAFDLKRSFWQFA